MRPARSRSGTIASSLGRALRFRPLWIISSLASETVSVESCRRQMTSSSRDGVPATADQGPRWDVRTWARAETARRRGRGSREARRGPRGASGGLQRNASVWQESKRSQGSTLPEQVASQADLEADHQRCISTRRVCLRSTTSPITNCRVRCCNTHPSTSDSGESTGTRRPAPPVPRAPAGRTPRVRPVQLRLARPPAYTLLHSEPVRKPRLHNQRSAHRARRQCALAPGAGLHRAQLTAAPHTQRRSSCTSATVASLSASFARMTSMVSSAVASRALLSADGHLSTVPSQPRVDNDDRAPVPPANKELRPDRTRRVSHPRRERRPARRNRTSLPSLPPAHRACTAPTPSPGCSHALIPALRFPYKPTLQPSALYAHRATRVPDDRSPRTALTGPRPRGRAVRSAHASALAVRRGADRQGDEIEGQGRQEEGGRPLGAEGLRRGGRRV